MRNKEARSKEAGWDEDYPKVRVCCLVVITPAVKYRRFYLPKFPSAALPSVDVAPLRRLLPPCRWKFILRKIRRYLTAGVISGQTRLPIRPSAALDFLTGAMCGQHKISIARGGT